MIITCVQTVSLALALFHFLSIWYPQQQITIEVIQADDNDMSAMQPLVMNKECPLLQEFNCPFLNHKEPSQKGICNTGQNICWLNSASAVPELYKKNLDPSARFTFLIKADLLENPRNDAERSASQKIKLHAGNSNCNLLAKLIDQRHMQEKQHDNQPSVMYNMKKTKKHATH